MIMYTNLIDTFPIILHLKTKTDYIAKIWFRSKKDMETGMQMLKEFR